MRCLQELGYKVLNTITWQKTDPPPNLSCRYFNFSTELIMRKGKEGSYQIWTKETLEQNGFSPEVSDYYVVIQFDNTPVSFREMPKLKQRKYTHVAKILPLSEFVELR